MNQLLFINIPKNASTSLYEAFADLDYLRPIVKNLSPLHGVFDPRHMSVQQIADTIGEPKLKELFIIGCVRNPYDRIVSAYEFAITNKLWRVYQRTQPTFEEFARVYCKRSNEETFFHAWTQTKWLTYKNEIRADALLEFEQLEDEYEALVFTFQLDLPQLPHLNGNRHEVWNTYYDSKTAKMVFDAYSADFENFNYSEEI